MSVTDLATLVDGIDEIKEAVEASTPKLLEMCSGFRPAVENFVDFQVEMTDRAIKKYVKLGYTKKEAITLVLYNKQNLLKYGRNSNK